MKRSKSSWLSTIAKLGFHGKATRARTWRRPLSFSNRSRTNRFESLEERLALYASTTLVDNGPVDQRIDIVFLGDGFTNAQIQDYADKVETSVDEFFLAAPFDAYATYFNVHRVDVISNESGIDRPEDPTPISVDTPLDGKVSTIFGTANLLSVDATKAAAAAAEAPDWDLMQRILNGSGRANAGGGVANLSVFNPTSVHLHEVGHSLGGLSDEYDSEGTLTFTGTEQSLEGQRNLTTFTSAQAMIDAKAKWYRWLDDPSIGLFEGGSRFYDYGIYRPAQNSRMRDSSADFSVVDKEALIIKMYQDVQISPIEDATPLGTYYDDFEFSVTPMQPVLHDLDIQWFVNNTVVPGATSAAFNPSDMLLPAGEYTIKAKVVDNTAMVRDSESRAQWMTETREWTFVNAAPQVTNVVFANSVPNSYATNPAFEFDNVVGSGEQLRTVPVGGLDMLQIVFSEDVVVGSTDLALDGMQSQTVPGISSFDYDDESFTATWVFDDPLAAGQYLIRIDDAVHDLALKALDGEFDNPWSLSDTNGTSDTFPSGDGEAGGDFRFRFVNLPADATRDNTVGSSDQSIITTHYGGSSKTFIQGDANGDGLVNVADSGVLGSNWALDFDTWPSSEPGMILVSTTADDNDTDYSYGNLSLRNALAIAAVQSGVDTIVFADSLFSSGPATVTLSSALGQLSVGSDVNILGQGSGSLTITRSGVGRILEVSSGKNLNLQGLKIAGGNLTGTNRGGGIYNSGNLTLDRVEMSGNQTLDRGGAIFNNNGTLRIFESTLTGNSAAIGGAISSRSEAALSVVIEGSAITGNEADLGGGIVVDDVDNVGEGESAKFVNSTFSGNTAYIYGGGIYNTANFALTVINCTVTLNEAYDYGGGIYNSNGVATLRNTILAENIAADAYYADHYGQALASPSSYNVVGISGDSGLGSSNGNQVGSVSTPLDPQLTTLGDFGGPTKTHALLANSPAIDHGDDDQAVDANGDQLYLDQREYKRYFDRLGSSGTGGIVDVGAFEYATPKVANITISSTVSNAYGTNPPFQFLNAVGSADQLRTVPVGGANVVSIQFTDDVDVSLGDLELIALNRVVTIPGVSFSYEVDSHTATWTFASSLIGAQYLLRLDDSIEDRSGNSLDGEWVNPGAYPSSVTTSSFPSGDNAAGGVFDFVFTILPGDAGRNLRIDIGDLGVLGTHYGLSNKSWGQADFTGDGVVNVADLGLFSSYNNTDWRNLEILGDYDGDFDLDTGDEDEFLDLYGANDLDADLNGDSVVDSDDYDAFYELFGSGIDLDVLV